MYFMSFSALMIFSLHQSRAQNFTLTRENVNALQQLEEQLLPALDEFITNKEEHLKELERMISQTETVKTLSKSVLHYQEVYRRLGNSYRTSGLRYLRQG